MKLTNRCHLNGKTYTMELNCTEAQLAAGAEACAAGALIQNAFPFLNAGEREFLKTGTPPHVWDEMFGEGPAVWEEELAADQAKEQAVAQAREQAATQAQEQAYGNTTD